MGGVFQRKVVNLNKQHKCWIISVHLCQTQNRDTTCRELKGPHACISHLFARFRFYDSGDGAVVLEEDVVQDAEQRLLGAGPLRRCGTRCRQGVYNAQHRLQISTIRRSEIRIIAAVCSPKHLKVRGTSATGTIENSFCSISDIPCQKVTHRHPCFSLSPRCTWIWRCCPVSASCDGRPFGCRPAPWVPGNLRAPNQLLLRHSQVSTKQGKLVIFCCGKSGLPVFGLTHTPEKSLQWNLSSTFVGA